MALEDVSDYVVSSYMPTLTALVSPPPKTNPFKMLVAIEACTLQWTRLELSNIRQRLLCKCNTESCKCLITVGTSKSTASVKEVLSHLPSVSIAHFACHGTQSLDKPLESSLILPDGDLKISEIMRLSLPEASLAFLSACQTAQGDIEVPDEAIHIAATMLFVGFRGVVGTMWCVAILFPTLALTKLRRTIRDNDAPEIVDSFYGYLFRDIATHYPDTTEAARALHIAVKEFRKKHPKCSFEHWVPFIHIGL